MDQWCPLPFGIYRQPHARDHGAKSVLCVATSTDVPLLAPPFSHPLIVLVKPFRFTSTQYITVCIYGIIYSIYIYMQYKAYTCIQVKRTAIGGGSLAPFLSFRLSFAPTPPRPLLSCIHSVCIVTGDNGYTQARPDSNPNNPKPNNPNSSNPHFQVKCGRQHGQNTNMQFLANKFGPCLSSVLIG